MPRSFAALALSSASVCLASLLVAAPVLAQAPPGTGTDMELDPDATPEPPPPPPELPPPQAGEWGVGGGEDDGQYAPKGKTGALKEEEEEKAEAERDKGPLQLGPPGLLVVDTVIGFGDMLVVAQEVDGETTMTVVSFAAQGRYRFGDTWALGVRFPFTNGSVKGPKDDTTDDYSTFALGNLELQIQPTFHLNRRLSVPVAVSFFAPVAAGDLYAAAGDQGARAQAIVNQAASASRGWEETALFASKRAGTSLGAGIQYDRDALHLGVSTKLEIMKKAGGNEPPAALTPDRKGALQDPNTNWVTTVAGRYGEAELGVRPAHGDLGLAGLAGAEVHGEVVLGAVVAVAAPDFAGLREAAGGDRDAGADGRAVGAGAAREGELHEVAALAEHVLEEADLLGRVTLGVVAARTGVADDDVEVAVPIEVGDGAAVAAVVIDAHAMGTASK
jgi:hypothetical protein